ncbi:MAG: hypothetical protein ABFD08_17985 [Syntrophomonas sp.]
MFQEVRLCQTKTERAREVKGLELVPVGEKERATGVARDLEKRVETTDAADRVVVNKAPVDRAAGHRGPEAIMIKDRRLGTNDAYVQHSACIINLFVVEKYGMLSETLTKKLHSEESVV